MTLEANAGASFEANLRRAFLGTLAASSVAAYVRHVEDRSRRLGLKGTRLLDDGHGRRIEYAFTRCAVPGPAPILVLENGLGASLESWDWVNTLLRDSFHVLRYHRRGYCLTTSTLRPARLVERLLDRLAPEGDVVLCGHSIGGLVAANILAESPAVRSRTRHLVIVDGTDATLLADDRASRRKRERFKQDCIRRTVGSITGVNRWIPSQGERDVEYVPDIQKAYVTFEATPRNIVATWREYRHEPLAGQDFVAAGHGPRAHVIAAGDNAEQQRELAARLGATFDVVEGSTHRAVLGKLQYATELADRLRGLA